MDSPDRTHSWGHNDTTEAGDLPQVMSCPLGLPPCSAIRSQHASLLPLRHGPGSLLTGSCTRGWDGVGTVVILGGQPAEGQPGAVLDTGAMEVARQVGRNTSDSHGHPLGNSA